MPSIMKPSRLACAVQSEPVRGGGMTTVSAFALFDFAEPRRLLTEQALWPMVVEQMPDGAVFDKGKLKPLGEFIVAGCALSPGDEPIMGRRVGARLGHREKHLAVFGDRVWRLTDRGVEMLQVAPFNKMPIALQQAYGGPAHRANPLGKGHDARRIAEAGYDAPLPNVEDANRLIRSIDDRPPVAHFGPIAPDSAERMRYAGTYDRHWMKAVSPLPPEDFNPLIHCDAPEDQRFDGHFKGDETFTVTGMSRGEGQVGGVLPGLRPRAFVHRPGDNSFTEIAMVCDTVTLFPNVTKAVLSFRGLAKGESRFGDDVGTVMVAVEHAEDAPRPADYYLDVFRLRSDPDEAHKHALSDFQLMPQRDPDAVSARRAAKLEKARHDRIRYLENQTWAARKAAADNGMPPDLVPPVDPEMLDDMPLVAMPDEAEIESGEFDLAELLDDVDALEKSMRERADTEFARMELARRAVSERVPAGLLPDIAREPVADEEHMARHADLELDDAFADLPFVQGIPMPEDDGAGGTEDLRAELDRMFDDMGEGDKEGKAEEQFGQACARALNLPEGSLLHPARNALDDVSLDFLDDADGSQTPAGTASASAGLKDTVVPPEVAGSPSLDALFDMQASDAGQGEDADMRDRIGGTVAQSMPHLAADGADPLDRLMEMVGEVSASNRPDDAAATVGERIDTAKADGVAMLDAAEQDIDEGIGDARRRAPAAIFPLEPFVDGVAERLGAFVAEKLAEGRDFKGCDLAGAKLCEADFSGLDLSGTFFEQADLTGARFAGAKLAGAVFTGATLDRADFTGAEMKGANVSQASLRETCLDRCDLSRCTMVRADFTGASARGATMASTTLMQCVLDRADISGAKLSDLQVLQGSADGLLAEGAEMERAAFMDLSMKGVSFAAGRQYRVAFAQTNAAEANFADAEMTEVSFLGETDLTGGRFERIVARETAWNGAGLRESCFVRADCGNCLFEGCDMTASDLRLATLKKCRFGKTVLLDSDLFGANLFAAVLMQADLRRSSMRGANLYFADLLEARLASCDLTGANLGKTLLEQPVHA